MAAAKQEIQKIKQRLTDRLWRIENLYYIKNEKGEKVKFRLRDAQRRLLGNMHNRNAVLKSRQHGITSFACIYALDLALFNSNIRCGILAHEKEAAEEIFFDKVLYAYENLPDWLKACRPKEKRTTKQLTIRHGDGNYSGIRVATSLRSGTYQFVHISELGKICAKYPHKAKEIQTGTLPAAPAEATIIIESTAEGPHGLFYDICREAMSNTGKPDCYDYKFHFFGWQDNPASELESDAPIPAELTEYFEQLQAEGIRLTDRQKAYYAKQAKTYGENVFQEYPTTPAEAFRKPIEGAYYAEALNKARSEGRVSSVPYEQSLPVYTFWDLGISDSMSIWFAQFSGKEIWLIDYYENNNAPLKHYVQVLQEKGYIYGGHFGPHDINVREMSTLLSRKQILKQLGVDMTALPAVDVLSGIDAVRNTLNRCWFDKDRCDRGLLCLESYRKEYNEKMERYADKPLHDWASHAADAFRYLAVSYNLGKINGSAVNQPALAGDEPQRIDYDPIEG